MVANLWYLQWVLSGMLSLWSFGSGEKEPTVTRIWCPRVQRRDEKGKVNTEESDRALEKEMSCNLLALQYSSCHKKSSASTGFCCLHRDHLMNIEDLRL